MVTTLIFYFFASMVIISALLVITSKNPVIAVLWLIFCFCNSAGLMVLVGAEFVAMMLIIIYVGAVAVLFLFVVMMLDIKFTELKSYITNEAKFATFIAMMLFADLAIIIMLSRGISEPVREAIFIINPEISNTKLIAQHLYTTFILPFQSAGMILFVAMIATIVLTLRLRVGVKRQKVSEQMKRNKENSMEVVEGNCAKGIEGLNYED